MSLEQRMTRLERENKWLRRVVVFAVALFGVAAFMAAGRPQDKNLEVNVLRAQRIQLVDGNGNDIGLLGMSKDGKPTLHIGSAKGTINMTAMGGASLITLAGGNGSLELSSGTDKIPPSLWMHDSMDRERVRLEAKADCPLLALLGEKGFGHGAMALLACDEDSGVVSVIDKNGKNWRARGTGPLNPDRN